MKRIFCDCCGNEFEYNDALGLLAGKQLNSETTGKVGTVSTTVTVDFGRIEKLAAGKIVPGLVDLCKDCRIDIIKKLDTRPVVEQAVFKPSKLSQAQVEAIFVKHGGGTVDSYFLTKAKSMDVYRAIFKQVTGGDA